MPYSMVVCGSTGCKVPTKADAIKRKPLCIDLTPRQYIVDYGPDWQLVIGPEFHIRVETEEACLTWAFRDQNVPASLQGSLSGLKIELLRCPIKASQKDDSLTGPGFGRGWLHEIARQPYVLERDLQDLRLP